MTTSYKTQKKMFIAAFMFIPVTLLLLFLIYPTFKLLQLSITDWDGIGQSFNYIGFKNYWNVFFKSPEVWTALKNNFLYFFIHLLMIPVEIIFAVILCKGLRGFKFFKSITFMPYIINGVAVAYMFSFLYSPIGGPINSLLERMGLGFLALNWLGDTSIVNYSLVGVSLWRFSGLHVILFISGITSIPHEYYEAADIDGANALQKLSKITIPGIKRVVQMVLFLNVRGALQVFDIPFLITNGGPGFASSTFTTYTIDTAFKYDQYGMASAMAVVLMLLICLLSLGQNKLTKLRR
ncbi:sugar ABC transporter permease [Hydrogenoanaerobacterium sp.]|uniref:carbohydrate ABC transporter permease n=1 Tax=Hydrogenoanaerobacterium sp. TaxID=2953763 RepID=UPI00289E8C04|nr:sugar ABC transporter permease [Hydrogenoanaerobacterium sp.]